MKTENLESGKPPKKRNHRVVIFTYSLQGEKLTWYPSLKEAAQAAGMQPDNFTYYVHSLKPIKELYYQYSPEFIHPHPKIVKVKPVKLPERVKPRKPAKVVKTKKGKYCKPIYVFNRKGEKVGIYRTTLEAKKGLEVSTDTIRLHILTHKLLKGQYYLQWKEEFDTNL